MSIGVNEEFMKKVKILMFFAAMSLHAASFSSEGNDYDQQMLFFKKAIEESSGSGLQRVQNPRRCEAEALIRNTFGSVQVTNLRTYHLGAIKALRVQLTEEVPQGNQVARRVLSKTYPYSIVFDANYQAVAMTTISQSEMLQQPQFNKPPEIVRWSVFGVMFKSKEDAESALPQFERLLDICNTK
jgi:hypothetical protein